ncbi:MAG: hypothetical protein HOP28_11895 [Gemmatimonadales bacterium]|nr:hypothetical protein [Gemmatimonadales bacterium]
MQPLERRLRTLAVFNSVALAAIGILAASGFAKQGPARFDEIDVQRINVVGEDGKPVMVIARRGRLPGPSMNGRAYPAAVSEGRELLSGMIFFSETGDEVGGLLYNSIKRDSGYSAIGHLSLDQWKQNQVVALQYVDNGRTRRAGLQVLDRPTTVTMGPELDRLERLLTATGSTRDSLRREGAAARARGETGVPRIFVGSQDRNALVQLRDTQGRIRVQLRVDSVNVARLEFLDEAGKVAASYPPPGD